MKALLTSSAVCESLHISRATLSRMVKAGEIPYVLRLQGRKKKMVLFDEGALEKWLSMRARGPLSPASRQTRIPMVNEVVTQNEKLSNLANLNGNHRFEEPVAASIEHAQ